jgi:PAS domain S-box-containing protein
MGSEALEQQTLEQQLHASAAFGDLPIVGIGASAGGPKALERFFQHMPSDSGLAFVALLHLAPDHQSNLAGLIQNHTALPVVQVTEMEHVERNHVYVIPPSSQISMADGFLRLSEPQPLDGQAPIDRLFRTLAETHGPNAAAVVLSGAGSDGASGLKRVKQMGGVAFAQDPRDAEYDSMPRNAIATGLVDFVLPAAAIPAQLLAYLYHGAKNSLLAANQSRRQTELILESVTDAYIGLDKHWHCVYMNQAAERLLGMQRADFIGKDLRKVYTGADLARFFGQFQQVIDQRASLEFEAYYPSMHMWVEMRVFPTSDGGIALYQRDISERKQVEERMRISEERMRLLNENVLDYAITMLDTDGRFIDWNVGAERMFGYTAEEALGQPSALIFTPEDRAAGMPEREMRTAATEGRAEDERWHLRKDGSRFWVSGVMTPLRDEQGRLRGYAKVARDLTERMRAEEALHRAHDDLELRVQERTTDLAQANRSLQHEIEERSQAQRARDEVVRLLITADEQARERLSRELHDQIGQQLTALLLGLQSLKQASSGRAKALATIDQLYGIADQIGREAHQLALDLRPTALDDLGLAAALANYAGDWARRSQVGVNFHSHGLDEPRPASEIETTIYRVVLEALNNVARHARAAHVSIVLERRDNQVIAIVEDDGRGFDAEAVIAALRAEQRLGLLGMRERVAQVGGTLTVESNPGSGTTVIARIPLLSSTRT